MKSYLLLGGVVVVAGLAWYGLHSMSTSSENMPQPDTMMEDTMHTDTMSDESTSTESTDTMMQADATATETMSADTTMEGTTTGSASMSGDSMLRQAPMSQ